MPTINVCPLLCVCTLYTGNIVIAVICFWWFKWSFSWWGKSLRTKACTSILKLVLTTHYSLCMHLAFLTQVHISDFTRIAQLLCNRYREIKLSLMITTWLCITATTIWEPDRVYYNVLACVVYVYVWCVLYMLIMVLMWAYNNHPL